MKGRLSRLLDAHLDGALDLVEYRESKNRMLERKASLEGKLALFERKGNHWLEPTHDWIISANKALNLASGENFLEMKK